MIIKHIIEKEEANQINIDLNKNYVVTYNHNDEIEIGICKVVHEENVLKAVFDNRNLKKEISGYPSISYQKVLKTGEMKLISVSICSSKNIDKSIQKITLKL